MLEEKLGRARELCDSPNTTRDKHVLNRIWSVTERKQENDRGREAPGRMVPIVQPPAARMFMPRAVILNDSLAATKMTSGGNRSMKPMWGWQRGPNIFCRSQVFCVACPSWACVPPWIELTQWSLHILDSFCSYDLKKKKNHYGQEQLRGYLGIYTSGPL